MNYINNFWQLILQTFTARNNQVTEESRKEARKYQAGSKQIMTAEERQEFLRTSKYGRIIGVAKYLKKKDEKPTST